MKQICFFKDGFMYCNAIKKNGRLVFKPDGRYYRFEPYTKKAQKAEEPDVKV